MKFLCLSVAAIALALGACERHSWEDVKDEDGNVVEKGTKNLYKPHGAEEGGHEDHKDGEGHDEKKESVGHDHDGDGKADRD